MKRVLKNDRYRKTRGGHARLLAISCAKCGAHLCYYQKDGAGHLKRLYLDRLLGASSKRGNFSCIKCKELIGVSIVYKKEKRLAVRLFAGAVTKQVCALSKHKIDGSFVLP